MAKQTGSVLTLDSYQFSVTIAGGTDAWALDRVTNGASASTIASGSQEISAGNIIGVRVHNGTVEGWYYNGSVWSLMGSGSDSTYTGTGNAYILLVGTTFRLGYAGCGNVRGAGLINNTAVMASRVGGGLIG
ncbi:MAG: hypothetical protein GY938_16660 [Ketobacter sp.]|nr:hypothetical protein [Ketobacter sp.]